MLRAALGWRYVGIGTRTVCRSVKERALAQPPLLSHVKYASSSAGSFLDSDDAIHTVTANRCIGTSSAPRGHGGATGNRFSARLLKERLSRVKDAHPASDSLMSAAHSTHMYSTSTSAPDSGNGGKLGSSGVQDSPVQAQEVAPSLLERVFWRFTKKHITAKDTFNRWKVVPASFLIQISVGSVYAWSVFNNPLCREIGVVAPAAADWGLQVCDLPQSTPYRPLRDDILHLP